MWYRYDARDSPPVPVAVGSPVCAIKSLDTKGQWGGMGQVSRFTIRTIEEGVEAIVLDLAQLKKVFARARTPLDLEVNDEVAE